MATLEGSLDSIAAGLHTAITENRRTHREFVIVNVGVNRDWPYFGQFLFPQDVIYGEVVSNVYIIPEHEQLRPARELRLLDLGWSSPYTSCRGTDCEDYHSNFHRVWILDTPTDKLVHDMLTTLVAIYLRGEGDVWGLKTGRVDPKFRVYVEKALVSGEEWHRRGHVPEADGQNR